MKIIVSRLLFFILITLVCCKSDNSEIPPSNFEGLFEKIWSDFDKTYSYFKVKGIDWDSIYTIYKPQVINGITTDKELISIVAQMTLALNDLHVSFSADGITYRYEKMVSDENSSENAINYLTNISSNTTALTIADIKGNGIQYIRIKNLASSGDFQPLESVISKLPSIEGLILDLRNNGGGNDAIAKGFVNQFTEVERVYELVRFRNGPDRNDFTDWIEAKITPSNPINFDKPIIVLTNRGVISSAESFVNMLRTLPNTIVVGDTTRGSSGNPRLFKLSNGWEYQISSWQVATPDYVLIEDYGIVPDFVIQNTKESTNNGQDIILEKAIELIKNEA